METRQPTASGTFYPADAAVLRRLLAECYNHPLGPGGKAPVWAGTPGKLFGLIVPHAGYICSGPIAAHGFRKLAENGFRWLFMAGPNHTGGGAPFGLMAEGLWKTPLGTMEIDRNKAFLLMERIPHFQPDTISHRREHSLEVQLPWIQDLLPEISFVPLCVSSIDLSVLKGAGREIGKVLSEEKGGVFIASTDLSHYHPEREAHALDQLALDAMRALDADLLFQRVMEVPISMCGFAPVIMLLEAARQAGATKVELLRYATSGETCGGPDQVVGYAALTISFP
jgi:AmmeMemoRadiSam system protein B